MCAHACASARFVLIVAAVSAAVASRPVSEACTRPMCSRRSPCPTPLVPSLGSTQLLIPRLEAVSHARAHTHDMRTHGTDKWCSPFLSMSRSVVLLRLEACVQNEREMVVSDVLQPAQDQESFFYFFIFFMQGKLELAMTRLCCPARRRAHGDGVHDGLSSDHEASLFGRSSQPHAYRCLALAEKMELPLQRSVSPSSKVASTSHGKSTSPLSCARQSRAVRCEEVQIVQKRVCLRATRGGCLDAEQGVHTARLRPSTWCRASRPEGQTRNCRHRSSASPAGPYSRPSPSRRPMTSRRTERSGQRAGPTRARAPKGTRAPRSGAGTSGDIDPGSRTLGLALPFAEEVVRACSCVVAAAAAAVATAAAAEARRQSWTSAGVAALTQPSVPAGSASPLGAPRDCSSLC